MKKILLLIVFLVFGFALLISPDASAEPQGKPVMFHAGSLNVPFETVEKEFEARYPKIDLLREASGSTKAARKITDKKRPCDIMASAGYKVIDKLLIPKYADWNIRFATNQLVLCYTGKRKA